MSLILDHRNGVADDNRLENLRIVCPICDATLDTHCGKQLRKVRQALRCPRCEVEFVPKDGRQRCCSRACGQRWDRRGKAVPGLHRVQRPPYEQLCAEIAASGYEAVGRRFGVSGDAIRKWRRAYEAQQGADGAGEGAASTMP